MNSEKPMDEAIIKGACSCGLASFTATKTPIWTGLCHCATCQRFAGGPFMAFCSFEIGSFTWTNPPRLSFRSSPIAQRFACHRCGNPCAMLYDDDEEISVPWSMLPPLSRPTPTHQIFPENRASWVDAIHAIHDQDFLCSLSQKLRDRLKSTQEG